LRYYFLLVFGFCAIAFAWGENIQSMEADFEQLIENEGGIDMFYKGKIFGKSPNKAKWEYQMPLKKEIYMNNGEVMIYEPALEQVSYSRLRTKSDFISIMKSAIKQADGSYRTSVDNVEYTLYVDKNDKPKSISFVDSMGSKSVLKFSNVKLNGTLNDKLFVFKVPEGVEVVEIKSR
ncbi:LolA-like outer membrane lipoprotein chaperone, partial [Helicobacter typhlonius]